MTTLTKNTRILNNTSKVYNNLLDRYKDEYFEQYKQYNEEWKEKYDYKNFNDLTDDKIFNIDLSWMYNPQLYDKISQDVVARYNKDKHSNELESIQTFLDNITNEYIKNKKDALEEFKAVKNNVKSENLKDIVKELERAIFGYDYDNDNQEPKYEESIAERTKMRRQNKETAKIDASRTFAPPDPKSDDSDKFTEMCYTSYSSIIDDEKTEEETEQTEKVYEEGYDKEGYDGTGYNKWGFNKDGFNEDGYDNLGFNKDGFNKDGFNEYGFNKDGFNKDGKKDKKFNKWGYNINGIDRQGLNRDRYNINGYNINGRNRDNYNINGYNSSGYDRDRYNINGYNARGLNRRGNKRKALKKNIPGSGLKILTPQQMLARLPILLAQIKAGNNSRELKNKIRQLLYSVYKSKKISKTVYKNLIATF